MLKTEFSGEFLSWKMIATKVENKKVTNEKIKSNDACHSICQHFFRVVDRNKMKTQNDKNDD